MYILFIDDEESVLNSIRRSLYKWFKDNEITPLLASTVKAAISELKEHGNEITVVVSDQKMPDLNGSDFISMITERFPDIVSIILSGKSGISDFEDIVKTNVFSYISKPWKTEDLQKEIIKAIDHFNIRRENRVLKEKINRELSMAKEFQRSLMSNTLIDDFPIKISVTYKPCSSSGVSGDYYEIIKISSSKVVVLLGDVSGHGIQPSFISMALKSIIPFEYFKNLSRDEFSTIEFTSWLNRRLCDYLSAYPGLFLTFTCLLIDIKNNNCFFTNAGQPNPVVIGKNSIKVVENSNIVLGVNPEYEYTNEVLPIDIGSKIFLSSDGISPSGNNSSNYTDQDLIKTLERHKADILNHEIILDDLYKNHIKDKVDDDITILSIEII